MNEEARTLDSSIEALYNLAIDKPRKVYEIFKDFFGEDKVDMQGYKSKKDFKDWLTTTCLVDFIAVPIPVKYSRDAWISILEKTLLDLEEAVLQDILPVLTLPAVVRKVARLKFNDIFILVYFPHVRITNEHDRFVDIQDLFAKVRILSDGSINGRFSLNRATYSTLHMDEGYMHSHICCIPTTNFREFQNPCLGSGPILDTIANLSREFDESIWNLFCLELSKYVTVESISGRPYHYLEELGKGSRSCEVGNFLVYNEPMTVLNMKELKLFTEHFIKQGKLKFNYDNGSYSIGMSYTEYMVLISNEFIKWYNKAFNKGVVNMTYDGLLRGGVLSKCIIAGNTIYKDTGPRNRLNYSVHVGKPVCTFKGKEITIQITDVVDTNEENKTLLLNSATALYILDNILKVLNYRYGRCKAIHTDNQDGTDVEYL